ncbi:MAG: type IV fimbrial biogenesis protein FimT [Psychromonas sp.]|jgi:type IV fimbrial biogenesis protein FimT|uniref:GspH/FimT family pseudopilin n=1 Tax=Psychromonas sp. TaxID=1884585 RepID=UPI0039E3E4CA
MEIKHNNHRGFTLIELLVALTVMMILVSVSVSNYGSIFAQRALIQKTEQLYYFLRLAKTQAIQDNKQIYVHFCQQGSTDIWKMIMTDSDSCDCTAINSCLLNGNNKVEQLSDGKKLFAAINFSSQQASYKPMRFHVSTGNVTLSNNNGDQLKVIQSSMRLRLCSPDKAQLGYEQC